MQERGWNGLEEAWDEDAVEDPRPARPAERDGGEMAQAVQEMSVDERRPGQMMRGEEGEMAGRMEDLELRDVEEVLEVEEEDPDWFVRLYEDE